MADIEIIDNYGDLSIGDYEDIIALDNDENMDELTRQVKTISILTGLDEDNILDMPIGEYKNLSVKASFLTQGLPETGARIMSMYQAGDFELVPVTDIRKVTTAQYIDFQTFHQAGMEEHFVEIISCLLVPKGKKYNQDYEIMDVQSAIRKDISVFDAVTLYGFFLISCRDSMRDILISSMQEVRRGKTMEKGLKERTLNTMQNLLTVLQKDGDGSPM